MKIFENIPQQFWLSFYIPQIEQIHASETNKTVLVNLLSAGVGQVDLSP